MPSHRLSLSTYWDAHRHSDGLVLARQVRDMGFPELEISHKTPATLLPGLLQAVKKKVVRVSSLHAPCPAPEELQRDAPDACEFTADDETLRQRALSLTVATLEMAARFGTDRVVLRAGSALETKTTEQLERMAFAGKLHSREYVREKLRLVEAREKAGTAVAGRLRDALETLLPHCEKHGVRLALETRPHYEQIPNASEFQTLIHEYAACPWVGFWHDFGHVQRQANLGFLDHAELLELLAPRLLGCHVHDVEWPARDHQLPFRHGGVDFDQLLPLLPEGIPLVWELSPKQKRLEIIAAREAWEKRYSA